MNLRDRKRKQEHRTHHNYQQKVVKLQQLEEAIEAASRARKPENKDLVVQMLKRGFVPTVKGGWKRLPRKVNS